ncbi:cell division protein FtsX [Bradyrhizobium sp. F1.13.4]
MRQFGVLLQAARDAAEQIGTDFGHLGPGRSAILELIWLVGSTGIAAGADTEEVQRHR